MCFGRVGSTVLTEMFSHGIQLLRLMSQAKVSLGGAYMAVGR